MRTSHQARGALDRARRAAAQVRPLARSTRTAARTGVHAARARAAPQVERTGQVLQDSVAPTIAGLLSSVARRLEPARPRRWRKLAGISTLTAAASAAAAAVLHRRKPDPPTAEAEADTGDVTPAAQTTNRQARRSADAGPDGQVRTS
jgi:hypothetical protein